jgi:NADP-dependent 3-hydroxy acid dehydrogenase YdfG
MSKTILISGASSGFGALVARALADAGHLIHTAGRNRDTVDAIRTHARGHGVDLQAIELGVSDQASVDAAVDEILARHESIDVFVHNAGHMVLGPLESFTPEQQRSSAMSTPQNPVCAEPSPAHCHHRPHRLMPVVHDRRVESSGSLDRG